MERTGSTPHFPEPRITSGRTSVDTYAAFQHQPSASVPEPLIQSHPPYPPSSRYPASSLGPEPPQRPKPFFCIYPDGASNLDYTLPETVKAVREGWQWTCQSGAVVSGLLAAVAAQLLIFFKADSSYSPNIHLDGGPKAFIIGSCYAALLLNISATISSFILIDNLGEIGFKASCKGFRPPNPGMTETTNENKLLIKYGASREWKWMLYHWVITFYTGILALIISVLTYILVQESLAMKFAMGSIVVLTLGPITWFIIFRPLIHH